MDARDLKDAKDIVAVEWIDAMAYNAHNLSGKDELGHSPGISFIHSTA